MGKLTIAICFASIAFGQQVDRVFQLTHATNVISRQEISNTLRQLAHVPEPSIDNAAGTLTVKGTVDQLGLAEWLVPKLDVEDGADSDPQEYRAPGNADDVVAVLGGGAFINGLRRSRNLRHPTVGCKRADDRSGSLFQACRST